MSNLPHCPELQLTVSLLRFSARRIFPVVHGLPNARGAFVVTLDLRLLVVDLQELSSEPILEQVIRAWYTPTGHLVYVRNDATKVAEFEGGRFRTSRKNHRDRRIATAGSFNRSLSVRGNRLSPTFSLPDEFRATPRRLRPGTSCSPCVSNSSDWPAGMMRAGPPPPSTCGWDRLP